MSPLIWIRCNFHEKGICSKRTDAFSLCGKRKRTAKAVRFFVSALPIFPVRLQTSIFGADELNCRVRDGNGWTLIAINTDYSNSVSAAKISIHFFFGKW